jgi:hypothetical protein
MAERATSPPRAVAKDDSASPAIGKRGRAPTRELAQRLSGTVEILLLWHPEIDRVELSVGDVTTGEGFHIEVAPGNAMDAFHHPYVYAPRRENLYRVVRAETTIIDG